MTIRKAGKYYGVPWATINSRLQYKHTNNDTRGPYQFALTEAQEDAVEEYCLKSAQCGWPLRRKDIAQNIRVTQSDSRHKEYS